METLEVARKIEEKIKLLERGRETLNDVAKRKAESLSMYEKSKAEEILKLKAEEVPITLIPDLAKGRCWKERQEMDLAESMYRIAIVKLEIVADELNGYQSIFKYLDTI